jgi:fumarylacetoacetate (FAA) hydrolase
MIMAASVNQGNKSGENAPMKLATYKDGSRDGQLLVVSRDLATAAFASHIANRLQQVLDDWNYLSPQLQDVYDALNAGRARQSFPFDAMHCMAPLPRAYQHTSAVAFPCSADAMDVKPPEPPQTQLSGDGLLGPFDSVLCSSEALGIDFEAEVAVVTGDVPMGATVDRALDSVRLVMLGNVFSLRSVLQGKPATAFSAVAITPDELGTAWVKGRAALPLQCTWNGRKVGLCDAGADMVFHFGHLIADLAKTRAVRAGSIVGSGAVRNLGVQKRGQWEWPNGYSSIADKRAMETLQSGQPITDYLKDNDTVRLEMKTRDGNSLFGAMENEITLVEISLVQSAVQKS